MFGQQVEFTFKGNRTYQTGIGALVSIIIKSILAMFIVYAFYVIFSRKHPILSTFYMLTNTAADPGSLDLTEKGFDIAFALTTTNSNF
jgi:hypothetical protein